MDIADFKDLEAWADAADFKGVHFPDLTGIKFEKEKPMILQIQARW